MTDDDLIKALRARKPGTDFLIAIWKLIGDVVAEDIKTKCEAGWKSEYIPQGRLEADSEYSARVAMTPGFFRTPEIINARNGTLFADGVETTLPDGVAVGRQGEDIDALCARVSTFAQMYGMAALVIERAEGAPAFIGVYTAEHVLDWEFGSDGALDWIKIGSIETERATWRGSAAPVEVYRIIDRISTNTYRIIMQGEQVTRIETEVLLHDFAAVPAALIIPYSNADGIGLPIVRRSAESDIAATRVLSDLVWDLFLVGNPILTFKTNKSPDQLQRLHLSPSRYIPLEAENKLTGSAGEELEFVQLDPAGVELLFKAHALFMCEGDSSKASVQESSTGVPQAAASGVSQAWTFATGEQRICYVLGRAIEHGVNAALAFWASANAKTTIPTITMPATYGERATLPTTKGQPNGQQPKGT